MTTAIPPVHIGIGARVARSCHHRGLPVPAKPLLKQTIVVGNAGFGVVQLQVAAPPLLELAGLWPLY